MLKISNQQMVVLAAAQKRRTALHLSKRAMRRHPEACQDRDLVTLVPEITQEIDCAHAAGLQTLPLLERFTDLSMVLGVGFVERERWARDIWNRRDLSPPKKLRAMEETAVFIVLGRRS